MISQIHPIPAFTDNYIWAVSSADDKSLAVVDPGDAAPVIAYIEANDLQLSHILITHHHPDHTGGLGELKSRFDPVIYGPEPSGIPGITNYLHEADRLELFGLEFSIIEVPGHTLDHIAYYCDEVDPPILFCGDTLFAAGCGRLFEGTPAMMLDSLGKLQQLAPDTRVYCTHEYTLANLQFAQAADGNNKALLDRVARETEKRRQDIPTLPSTIEMEISTNPFLRCDDPDVIANVQNNTKLDSNDITAVFAALRGWKDSF